MPGDRALPAGIVEGHLAGGGHKMIHIYKAPVEAKDVDPIVDYLAGIKPAN